MTTLGSREIKIQELLKKYYRYKKFNNYRVFLEAHAVTNSQQSCQIHHPKKPIF